MKLNRYLKYIPWVALALIGLKMIFEIGDSYDPEVLIKEKIVKVPKIEKQFDTVYKFVPKEVKVVKIDSTYYRKYLELKNQAEKDSLFRESIKINNYTQVFEDSTQTITVNTESRGEVLSQSLSYEINEREIIVTDTIKIEAKPSLSLLAEVGVPTVNGLEPEPIVKGGLVFTNRKGNSLSLSYDTQGRFWVGKTWKIKLKK